ncbi:MAG TPA: hypothetical protein ENK18_17455 [Deltaproteobacteria bacterium]|nr:hypothetical protein [Deltaproteobacteria bacterium]
MVLFGGIIACIPLMMFGSMSHARKLKELEIRELEARARLMEAEAQAALPSYVDTTSPESIDAYRRARRELQQRQL